jgi:quinol monooxygenase YgiN
MSRVKVGFMVRIEAKAGKEEAVAALLRGAVEEVAAEQDTIAWLALRLGPTSFAVVDVFPHEEGRQAHLEAGRKRLAEAAGEDLFAQMPELVRTDVVAAKLP